MCRDGQNIFFSRSQSCAAKKWYFEIECEDGTKTWFTKSPGAILDMRSMARWAAGRKARHKSCPRYQFLKKHFLAAHKAARLENVF
jgi:hypothetical protein